jgi:hypothetical protein
VLSLPPGDVWTYDDTAPLIVQQEGPEPLLSLVEREEVVWTARVEGPHGLCDVLLREARVEIDTCDGGATVLARRDGHRLDRHGPFGDPSPGWWGPRIGPYILQPANTMTGDGDVVVHDTRDGREVARLPEHSWPVAREGATGWDYDLGGTVIARGQNWLVALQLPADRPPDDEWPPRRIGVRTR